MSRRHREAMVEKCPRVPGHIAFHLAKLLAFGGPSPVQFSSLREEVDIKFATTGMSEEMSFVGLKCLFAKDFCRRHVRIGKTAHSGGIALHELFHGQRICQCHAFPFVVEDKNRISEVHLGQLRSLELVGVFVAPIGNTVLPVGQSWWNRVRRVVEEFGQGGHGANSSLFV